jgi:hypothetical protein
MCHFSYIYSELCSAHSSGLVQALEQSKSCNTFTGHGTSIYVLFLTFSPLSSTESRRISKLCFQLMDLGSWKFGPFANTSPREVLVIMLRPPVITWPSGLYIWIGNLHRYSVRLILEVVNVEILQHIVGVKYWGCNKCGKRHTGI